VSETTSAPQASILIPVYNEEILVTPAVEELIEALAARLPDLSYEIIVAENGSSDRTLELAYELEKRFDFVRAIRCPEPNYGAALKRAMLEARGTYVLCDEIDICDVDFHARALEILMADEADMVIGSKAHADAEDKRPLLRRTATLVLNGMLRVLLGFTGTDTHGLKAFQRERLLPIVSQCIVDKDIFASEFVIRSERGSLRILEIPVAIEEKRPPSINLMKRVPHVLKSLVRLTWAIRVAGRS
jgi:glycosyltransferase involved in cell wall biosynthesis